MPFNSAAISAADLVRLRGDSTTAHTYGTRILLSVNANDNVYTARVNQTEFLKPLVQITYDAGSGVLGDVKVGMTVLIAHEDDRTKAFFRGRVRLAPTASIIYINETGEDIQDDDYIYIIDDYDTWAKFPRVEEDTYKLDWDQSYSGLPPLIYDIQSVYADYVNASDVYEIEFAPTVTAAESGASISTYLWTIPTGGTITSGTVNDKDITVEFDPGEYWVSLTATDDGGLALTRWIKVFAHDESSNTPTVLAIGDVSVFCDIPIEVNEGGSSGWGASIPAFDGVDTILDRSLVCLWLDQRYNGSEADITNNIAFVGRMRNEQNQTIYDDEGQIDASVSFDCEGPVQQLATIDVPSFLMENSNASSTYALNITDLTLWRAQWAILTQFSTFANVHSLEFDDVTDTFEYGAGLNTQGSDILNSVADLAQSITACMEDAPDGRCEIVRRAVMLDDTGRDALVTVANLTTTDIVEDLSNQRDYIRTIGAIESQGGGYQAGTDAVSAWLSVAPPGAPDQAPGEASLPRQILEANESTSNEQAELKTRVGDAFAAVQSPELLPVKLNDGWNFLIPAVDQWYTITLDGTETVRGVTYDTNTRWWLQALDKTFNIESGTIDTIATFVKETDGSDGEIIALPTIDTGLYGNDLAPFTEIDELIPIADSDFSYDFTSDDGGWTALGGLGSHNPGNGWEPTCVGGNEELMDIFVEFDTTVTLTGASVVYDAVYAGGADNQNQIFCRTGDGQWQSIHSFTTTTGNGETESVTLGVPVTATAIRLIMYAGGSDCTGSLTVTSFTWDYLEEQQTWTETIDFTLSNGGWVVTHSPSGGSGSYSAGTGWVAVNYQDPGYDSNQPGTVAAIKYELPFTTTVTSAEMLFDMTKNGVNSGSSLDAVRVSIRTTEPPPGSTPTDIMTASFASITNGTDITKSGSATGSGLWLDALCRSADDSQGGSATLKRIILTGTGRNPFA